MRHPTASELKVFLDPYPQLQTALSTFISLLRSQTPARTLPRPKLLLLLLDVIKQCVSQARWSSGAELLLLVEAIGREVALVTRDVAFTNIIGRVMKNIRDEIDSAAGAVSTQPSAPSLLPAPVARQPSLTSTLFPTPPTVPRSPDLLFEAAETERLRSLNLGEAALSPPTPSSLSPTVCSGVAKNLPKHYFKTSPPKGDLMESLTELYNDISTSHHSLFSVAHHHLSDADTVLTYGKSHTVQEFLSAGRKKRGFKVIHACGGDEESSATFAKTLAASNIHVTLVPAVNVPTVIPMSTIFLLGADAVLANGGVVAPSGALLAATTAVEARRPVVVVVDLSYKLTRRYPHEGQDTLNSLLNPMSVLPRGSVLGGVKEGIELVNPESDYIPPELIELMVTNVGTWKPSYVYRLLQDAFCEADPVHFEVGTD